MRGLRRPPPQPYHPWSFDSFQSKPRKAPIPTIHHPTWTNRQKKNSEGSAMVLPGPFGGVHGRDRGHPPQGSIGRVDRGLLLCGCGGMGDPLPIEPWSPGLTAWAVEDIDGGGTGSHTLGAVSLGDFRTSVTFNLPIEPWLPDLGQWWGRTAQ